MILKHYHYWTVLTENFKDLQIDVITTIMCARVKQLEKIMLIKASSRREIFSFLKEFRREDNSEKYILGLIPLNRNKNLILSIIRMKYKGSIDSLLYEYHIVMQKQYIHNGFEYWLLIVPSKTIIKSLEVDIKKIAVIKKLRVKPISPYELLIYFGKSEVLTLKEKEIILLSYHKGLLDWPRRENLSNLSQTLKITKPTVLEHLRRGLKKLIEANICMNYFDWYHTLRSEQLAFIDNPWFKHGLTYYND